MPRLVQDLAAIQAALLDKEGVAVDPLTFVFPSRPEITFDVTAHFTGGLICVELEPVAERRSWYELANSMQTILGTLRTQRTVRALTGVAAEQMRRLTGYDRKPRL